MKRIVILAAAAVGLMTSCADEPKVSSVSSLNVFGGSCGDPYCADIHEWEGYCPAECSSYDCLCCGPTPDSFCDTGGGGGGGGGGGDGGCSPPQGSSVVTLDYEGSCGFLRQCSSYTRECIAHGDCGPGEVLWGYCGKGWCDVHGDKYMAAPPGYHCGQEVTICRVDDPCICTTGFIQDRSNVGHWEGGPGIFSALQAGGDDGTDCAGTGNVAVYIKVL